MKNIDPIIKEFRLKALEASMELNKDSKGQNFLNLVVGQAIVIEHYLLTGSLLGDEFKPPYAQRINTSS